MDLIYKVRCCGFNENEDELWFPECGFNALVCVDKNDGKIRKIAKISENEINVQNLYSEVFKVDNDLILIPVCSDKIAIYNMDKKYFSYFSIRDYVKNTSISNYRAAYQHGDEIIMFPNRAENILIYNHLQKKVFAVEIENAYLDKFCPSRIIQFRSQFEILNDYLFIPFAETGSILKFNLSAKKAEIKVVEGLSGCDTINYYDGKFYLAAWNERKIYAVDMNWHITDVYTDYPSGLKANERIFAYSLLVGEKILYFPQMGNMIISFNLKDKMIKEEMRFPILGSDYTNTYIAKINGERIIALTAEDIWLSTFFYSDGILCKRPYCAWDADYNNKIIRAYLLEQHYFASAYESNGVGLHALINILEDDENNTYFKNRRKQIITIGKKIYWRVSEV